MSRGTRRKSRRRSSAQPKPPSTEKTTRRHDQNASARRAFRPGWHIDGHELSPLPSVVPGFPRCRRMGTDERHSPPHWHGRRSASPRAPRPRLPRSNRRSPCALRRADGRCQVLSGGPRTAQQIHDLGPTVVLATSAPANELARLRKILDADTAIDGQTTADQVANSKPDPEVFLSAMEDTSIDPRRALAIGDSVWDVQAARAAGIACITVETGGFSRHELSEEGSIAVYRDVAELLSQLLTSPVASLLTT